MLFRYYIVFLFVFIAGQIYACQCPLTKLDETELSRYELIFRGKIQSIKLNERKSEAVFEITDLFKGNATKEFIVMFDNNDPCKFDLRVGDEWLIYSNYLQIDRVKLDYCSRSRRFFKNIKEDYFAEITGLSYDEEYKILTEKLGHHKLLKQNENQVKNRNIIPNQTQFMITIIISIVAMVVFYKLFNKFFKF
jgi:hypothetical protein